MKKSWADNVLPSISLNKKMKIAIQTADLDAKRIDGTRVYINNILKYFGKINSADDFLLYHKKDFNSELAPKIFSNYQIIKKNFPVFWTQSRFAFELWNDEPDVLWMPMHNAPLISKKNLKIAVTIHDLAFFYFPEMFPKRELYQIKLLTTLAIKKADKIVAISESTKRDILKFYPEACEKDVRVIYHGFDRELFSRKRDFKNEFEMKKKFNISGEYILYTGGIQPRKNLKVLISAFDLLKKNKSQFDNLKLVLAGGKAWMWEGVFEQIQESPNRTDVIFTDCVSFDDLVVLYQSAQLYVYPSLYDGFGITPLEAFASRVPVICANNSSLPEVCGDAVLYFDAEKTEQLATQMEKVLTSSELCQELIAKGLTQLEKFSWEKCARETLDFLKS